MNNEERVFDYMAAAEETGQRLDSLVRHVPEHIKSAVATAVADEWRKVTVFKELSETIIKLEGAITEVRESVKVLRQTIWAAIIIGIVVAVAIPVAAWVLTNK